MLTIQNLQAEIDGKPILNGINLTIAPGKVYAIMGPNGSGKSSLANVIAGRDLLTVTQGTIQYQGQDLLAMPPEARALAGVFLAFQYPVEIPGVTNINFLKSAVNAVREAQGKSILDSIDFLSFIREKLALVNMDESFLYRALNEGFSGGEKKRNEMLQMAALEPTLAILDETDSGLDIDALRIVAEGVNQLRHPDRAIVLVTHYQRLLTYIEPDEVHVLAHGKIVKSGTKTLAMELEKTGYAAFEQQLGESSHG